jgi:hypothetical protein
VNALPFEPHTPALIFLLSALLKYLDQYKPQGAESYNDLVEK